MKVLVCGSRSWGKAPRDSTADVQQIEDVLRKLPRGTEIISGGARGADHLAAVIARRLGFQVTEFPANWRPNGVYNPQAGKERNLRMLDEGPHFVIAFWDGHSTGTVHTIKHAMLRSIPVRVFGGPSGGPVEITPLFGADGTL